MGKTAIEKGVGIFHISWERRLENNGNCCYGGYGPVFCRSVALGNSEQENVTYLMLQEK